MNEPFELAGYLHYSKAHQTLNCSMNPLPYEIEIELRSTLKDRSPETSFGVGNP